MLRLLILALLLPLMQGCASQPEYWKAGMFTPVPGPEHIIYTSELPQWVCAHPDAVACWIQGTAFVYMLDSVMLSEETCYKHHEVEMHKNRGYGHEPGSQQYDICGYGTVEQLFRNGKEGE